MISVIIPVHNQAGTLARALKSVWQQGIEDLEIVVVDDGSTDNVQEVLREFSGDGKQKYLRQANLGPAAARNVGIAASRGEFIAFLDADDFWLPGKLEKQLAAMKRTGQRFSFTGSQVVDAAANVLMVRAAADNDGEFSELVWGNRFPTPSVLVDRSLLDRCGVFDESLITGEDWDLWLRLAADGPGAAVSEPLVAITGEAHWQADARQLNNLEQSINAILARILELTAARERLGFLRAQQGKIRSWHYAVLAKSFLHAGKAGRSLKCAARAVAASPYGLTYLWPGSSQGSFDRAESPVAEAQEFSEERIEHFEVSVLIRTYNRAKMLPDALNSALNQTLAAKEILIIDDGSTDDTRAVVSSYQSKHEQIRYVRTEGNLGADKAARLGVDECQFDYVAFLDSDDLWLPNHLERAAIEFEKNVAAVLVFSKYGLVNERRDTLVDTVKEPALDRLPLLQILFKKIIIQPTRTVYSRHAILDVGGVPQFPAAEDWGLAVLLAARFPRGIIANAFRTAFFRMHGSQSYSQPLAVQKALLDATEHIFDRLPLEVQNHKRRVLSINLLHTAIFSWQAGETGNAWRSLLQAVKTRAATLVTQDFWLAFARLVVPPSIGKLIRDSKRALQRSRGANFSPKVSGPVAGTRP